MVNPQAAPNSAALGYYGPPPEGGGPLAAPHESKRGRVVIIDISSLAKIPHG